MFKIHVIFKIHMRFKYIGELVQLLGTLFLITTSINHLKQMSHAVMRDINTHI